MASIFDTGIFSLVASSSEVMPGALLYWYAAGTSTPATTYSSSSLSIANANPLVADASGRLPEIWLSPGSYKYILKTAGGVTLATRDNYVTTAAGLLASANPWTNTQRFTTNLTLSGAFIGNGSRPAYFALDEILTTSQGAVGNIGHSLAFYNSHGPTGLDNYGVGLFVAGVAHAGASDTWAANFANYVDVGVTTSSNQVVLELDQNILNGHYGAGTFNYTAATGAFQATPLAIVGVSGAGLYRGTSAILAQATGGGGPAWYRGIAFAGDSIYSATIQDDTNAPTIMLVSGAHLVGLDMGRATGMTSALITPYASQIIQLRSDTAQVKSYMASDDSLHCADGAVAVRNHCSFLPSADNAFTLGGGGARWSTVWAATGAINTSDPDAKNDAKPLPVMLDLVKAIVPFSAKYKIGGRIAEDVEELQWVQDTETVDVIRKTIEIRQGVPVEVSTPGTEEKPIFDRVPVVDEAGDPVMVHIDAQPEMRNPETGTIIRAAKPEQSYQQTHPVPRMVQKLVPVKKYVERAGVRDHFVFMADDHLKTLFDETGLDFAGYVVGEDGVRGLRYDQFIPVLWKAVQELAERVG